MSSYNALAQFYDELTGDVDYQQFFDYYEKLFSRYGVRPHTVLDLACGTGSLTALMAGTGYEMIAVDASEEMLMEARDKLYGQTFDVMPMLLCQSMTELDLYGTVDACVCSLDGMNYIPGEDLPEVFRRLRLFIAPGGVLVFDINSPYKLRSLDGEVFLDERDDVYCVWRAGYDEEENACVYGMDIFSRRGKLWERSGEEHLEYIHEPETLTQLLQKNGFGEIGVFGAFSFDAPREEEMRIFIAARRL